MVQNYQNYDNVIVTLYGTPLYSVATIWQYNENVLNLLHTINDS